eukprot:2431754-Karenia_brevis.AAC.1
MDPKTSWKVHEILHEVHTQARQLANQFQITQWQHIWGHPGRDRMGPYNLLADQLATSAVESALTQLHLSTTLANQVVPNSSYHDFPFRWILRPPPSNLSIAYVEKYDIPEALRLLHDHLDFVTDQDRKSVKRLLTSGRNGSLHTRYNRRVPFSSFRAAK